MRLASIGLSTLAVLALASSSADAQDTVGVTATAQPHAQNALYVELGGNGAWYTVNYERFIRSDASIRVGAMYMSITASAGDASANATWAALPVMFQYLGVASGSHALELAGGVSFNYLSGTASTTEATAMSSGFIPAGTATIGYRYSNPDGGFVFRAGYTPLFFVTTEVKEIFHWGGMSFGYRF